MNQICKLGRRQFLGKAAAATVLPHIIPTGVLAANGRGGAGERLTTALIGCGGMGNAHLGMLLNFRQLAEVNLAAVCDVDERRLEAAVKRVGKGCTPYRDYRYILDRDDIDAVVIATPDHWHAVQTVHACEAGKHVNVEKPSSCTVREGRAMVEAVRRHNRVVQVGSQARSARPAWQACTYVRNGMIGQVNKVTCWHTLNPIGGGGRTAVPKTLDWDLWLGPLRWRPYEDGYLPGSFRFLMESGGGVIRDRGAHVMSIALWCLDADDQTPVEIEATGSPPPHGLYDCPPQMRVVYTFKNPAWQLIWEQPGEELQKNPSGFGLAFWGEKEMLAVGRDGTRVPADKRAQRFKVPAGGIEVYRMDRHADYNMNHKEDWLQAIKTGRRPCMDIDVAHRVANMNNLGNLSYLLGRKLVWDGEKQEIVGDPLANRLLGRPQRHPYHV